MRPLRRRDLLRLAPAGLAATLGLPRLARAEAAPGDRRFLFVWADGGWDPTWVFAPVFDNPYVDPPPDGSTQVDAGGLGWVSHPDRPSVDRFFTTWGARTCVLNGLEVRSIAHERCTRILFTGSAAAGRDDIPTRLAEGAASHLPLAHVVFSGPAYGDGSTASVVRVGTQRQLASLLDGSCFAEADPPLRGSDERAGPLEDAFVRERAWAAAAAAGAGAEARIAEAYAQALDDLPDLEGAAGMLGVQTPSSLDQMLAAADLFQAGLSRCAVVADLGLYDERWDHHSEITRQGPNFESLFASLDTLVGTLAATPGLAGESLLDEVTVVVFSEMGRYPTLNASGGKDHWMTTSAMLIGGGIRGGQVLGAFDSNMGGTPVIPGTGELDPDATRGGVVLEPAHLGATLLALAGLDPAEAFGAEIEPIEAALDR